MQRSPGHAAHPMQKQPGIGVVAVGVRKRESVEGKGKVSECGINAKSLVKGDRSGRGKRWR
jgi:hypothetical protein